MKCKLEKCENIVGKKGILYCSTACSKIGQVISRNFIMDSIKEKRRKTNLERYGVENTAQSQELKEKYKKTNIERYGVENPLMNSKIRDRIKFTNIERYGTEFPTQNKSVMDSIKATNLKKYNVEFPSKLISTKEKTRTTNLLKYGRSNHTQTHITQDAILKSNDTVWLQTEHQVNQRPIYIIAEELGISKSQLGKMYNKNGIDVLYFIKSQEELEISLFIKSLVPDISIILNNRSIIPPKELDIYYLNSN